MFLRTLVAFSALIVAAPALAQSGDAAPQIKYKERTEIDFELLDVRGATSKPLGVMTIVALREHFNPLIRLRESFDHEIKQSVDEVK